MTVELAKAYVQIIPSLKGAKGTLEKELGGISVSTGQTVGTTMGASIVGTIGKTMKTGLVATGIAAGGVLTTALTKGFKRLSAFEAANKSLEGMKLSAQDIETVMGNASKAVEGTAFGLDEAATTAAGLLVSGVQAGEDLHRVLSLVGDTASQTGTSFSEMGVLWQKVLAKGKLQGDEALQLMERGIPIYQLVADHLGITAEAAQDLASRGKVSFETFASAMEERFAGSALKMGETVSGSWANLGAALGRVGQSILAGPFADLPGVFMAITDEIDAVKPAIESTADAVYKTVKGMVEVLSGQDYSNNLTAVWGTASGEITQFMVSLRENVDDVRGAFKGFGSDVSRELRPLTELNVSSTLDGLERVADLGRDVAVRFAHIGSTLSPVIGYLVDAGSVFAGGAFLVIERLAPSFLDLADAVADATVPITQLVVSLTELAVGVAVPLADALGVLVDTVAKLPAPVLLAGVAFLKFRSHASDAGKAVEKIRGAFDTLKLRHHLAQMDGLSSSAAALKTGFGMAQVAVSRLGLALKTAFMANAPMLALSALVGVIGMFQQKSAEAKQFAQEFADSLDQVTGAATESTTALMAQKAVDEGWVDLADELGISAGMLTEALVGNVQAYEQVQAAISAVESDTESYRTQMGSQIEVSTDSARAAQELDRVLADQQGVIAQSREAIEKKNRASQTAIDLAQGQLDAEKDLADFLRGQHDALFAYRDAQDAVNESIKRGAELAVAGQASQDEMYSALRDTAEAYYDQAKKASAAGMSAEDVQAIMDQGTQSLKKYGAEWGVSSEQISEAVDYLNAVPASTLVTVNADTDKAVFKLGEFVAKTNKATGEITINGNVLPAETTVGQARERFANNPAMLKILANADSANQSLASLLDEVNSSGGMVTIDGDTLTARKALARVESLIASGHEYVTIDGKKQKAEDVAARLRQNIASIPAYMAIRATDQTSGTVASIISQISRKTAYIRVGASASAPSMSYKADGGLVSFYANGGVRKEKHVAEIARPGTLRVWNEPETGGEAYIPLALAKRHRSTQILAQVAHQFGYRISQYANGGITQTSNTPVGFPDGMELVFVDADGALVGRMRSEAKRVLVDARRWDSW